MKNVCILHEYGANNHFSGLTYLLKKEGIPYSFYELNWKCQIRRGIKNIKLYDIIKGVRNFSFIMTLKFRKPSKIVVAIAPYNKILPELRRKLKRHQAYYFSSYTVWNQSTCVHDFHGNNAILDEWRCFLREDVYHIFAVSLKTKQEIVTNGFSTDEKVSVVNHSYVTPIIPKAEAKKTPVFIVVGGLVKHKGTEELLEIFSRRPDMRLIIVGKGEQRNLVESYSCKYSNIDYRGYISNQVELFKIYQEASFLILNSHKTVVWEELFGMVLVEASACGLIPIATDHSGPREIIHDSIDGFICEEGNIESGINKCLTLDDNSFVNMRNAAINNGRQYYMANIANKWRKILV